jgi:rhamnosyltransferase
VTPSQPVAPHPTPAPSCVGAVFVTFHPDEDFADRVRAVVAQTGGILIIDNGSLEEELAPVRELLTDGVAEVVLNGRNVGLARALNQGLEWGRRWGFAWVVTFDQDSVPGPALVAEAGRMFDAHRDHPIAVIGAGWSSQPVAGSGCLDPDGIEASHVITSGSLHSVAIWGALGGFRDDLVIDYVDTEYCLRARSSGYLVLRGCVPTLSHSIGNPTRRWLVFREVTPSNHSPARRYYITRNRILVWRIYWRREPRYVAHDMKAATKELVKLLLFESERPLKLRAMTRGLRDGLVTRQRPAPGPAPQD